MSSKTYTVSLTNDEADVLRATLYFAKTKMPKEVRWSYVKDVSMDVLARRLGLIPFETVADEVVVTLINDTPGHRLVTGKELDGDGITCLTPQQILLDMPPGEIQFKIVFHTDMGVNHARYDLLTKKIGKDQVTLQHPHLPIDEVLRGVSREVLSHIDSIGYQ